MLNPPDAPGIPGGDTIPNFSDGDVELSWFAGLPPQAAPIPGLNAVWLAPNACLMQSHLPAPEGEPLVIQVVGVADCVIGVRFQLNVISY